MLESDFLIMRCLALIAALTGFFSFAPPAQAQWAAMNAIRIDVSMGGATRNFLAQSQAAARQDRASARKVLAQPLSEGSKASLVFEPSLAVRKRNLANFVAKSRSTNPDGAAQLQQLFASTDVMGAVAKEMAPYGLRVDNIADAFAVYWINAWEAANGITGSTETRERAQAVKLQAANALLESLDILRAPAAAKQELAEALLIQAALISATADQAKSDPALQAQVKSAVAQGAMAMGLDLTVMTLTPSGFIPALSEGDGSARK
jgi:hypothetical protein